MNYLLLIEILLTEVNFTCCDSDSYTKANFMKSRLQQLNCGLSLEVSNSGCHTVKDSNGTMITGVGLWQKDLIRINL